MVYLKVVRTFVVQTCCQDRLGENAMSTKLTMVKQWKLSLVVLLP